MVGTPLRQSRYGGYLLLSEVSQLERANVAPGTEDFNSGGSEGLLPNPSPLPNGYDGTVGPGDRVSSLAIFWFFWNLSTSESSSMVQCNIQGVMFLDRRYFLVPAVPAAF